MTSETTPPPRVLALLLLIVAAAPIALLGRPILAVVLIVIVPIVAAVWLDPETVLGRRARQRHRAGRPVGALEPETVAADERVSGSALGLQLWGPLWTSCLLVSGVATAAVGVQLLCAALGRDDVGGCPSSLCSLAFARPGCASGAGASGPVDVSEVNASVIAAMYRPQVSAAHVQGLVLLEAHTTDGSRYLQGPDALVRLLQSVVPARAKTLAQAFRAANASAGTVARVQRVFPDLVLLDSMDVQRYLATPVGPGVVVPVSGPANSNLPQPVPLTGVLALSRPGVDSTGSMAVMFAALRTPQSDAPDKLERASVFLLQRDGSLWLIQKVWPLRSAPRAGPSPSGANRGALSHP